MYDGFVEAGRRGRAAAARPPHHLRRGHDARGGAVARGRRILHRNCANAASNSARSCSTRRPSRQPARPRGARRGHGIRAIRPARSGRRHRGQRRRIGRRARRRAPNAGGCCARSASRTADFSVVGDAGSRAARRSWPCARRTSCADAHRRRVRVDDISDVEPLVGRICDVLYDGTGDAIEAAPWACRA